MFGVWRGWGIFLYEMYGGDSEGKGEMSDVCTIFIWWENTPILLAKMGDGWRSDNLSVWGNSTKSDLKIEV